MTSVFADRVDAGRKLAAGLADRAGPDLLVCGIPRGGVVVAAEVARALRCPLHAVVARKVGAPGHAELAIGAVGPDGTVVLDGDLAARVGADAAYCARAVAAARLELDDRCRVLPRVVRASDVVGRTVLVVDDGVATGSTATAVGRWLAHAGAARRVLALPVGPPATVAALGADYEDVFALECPTSMLAVGQWYRDFTPTTDDQVAELLAG